MANILAENQHINSDAQALSEEETKLYLTPFAFQLDKSLFGLPLASPSKRAIALLIDLSLIALLSEVSGGVLALAFAVTLYYLGSKKSAPETRKTKGHKRRKMMRILAAMMVFLVLLDTLPPLFEYIGIGEENPKTDVVDESLPLSQSIAFAAITLSTINTTVESDCQALSCWQNQLNSTALRIANISVEDDINITKAQLDEVFAAISQATELPPHEQEQLSAFLHRHYDNELSRLAAEGKVLPQSKLTAGSTDGKNTQIAKKKDIVFPLGDAPKLTHVATLEDKEKYNRPAYSIIEWVKGIIQDLGLGFGWATFYFTAFIALGRGQTIGKKLVGIKVLQLDGTPLSLWDSFGRYGGYGAGLATGLLGFIQIYWDANKQGIHDKISATVVIDVRKPRLTQNFSTTR